ncbi:MAG: helix-turn-helix transcriptional regulator [Clostridia bacterium]|nr:helix-turn-helix transcriptional regulator [Clostridia bacterium]
MSLVNDIQENFKRGILEMLILKLLAERDMYGYEMKFELDARSDAALTIKDGSLYGPLYRLIGKNYISEHKELAGARRVRVYYHLEPLGKDYLDLLLSEYEKITVGVHRVIENTKTRD